MFLGFTALAVTTPALDAALADYGHAIAGTLEVPDPGVGLLHSPVDLVSNWLIPGLLVWWAARYTQRVSAASKAPASAPAAHPAR